MSVHRLIRTIALVLVLQVVSNEALHLTGSWRSGRFFKFLAKFGFQQTDLHDKENTQGYIYGNITSKEHFNSDITFVVVDSEYFTEYYGNRTLMPRSAACPAMLKKVSTIAWDETCNIDGVEDFLRKIPCPKNQLCLDEDEPSRVISGQQFTYAVQDTHQPRFWYMSIVSCTRNISHKVCEWVHNEEDHLLDFDIWIVNGNPNMKHINPFEHQFSFELHDVVEIYLTFFALYCILVPVQSYALFQQRHPLPLLLTISMGMEAIGIVFNFVHVFKFAFDGEGVEILKNIGNFIDTLAQCLFMMILLLIAKGWTITCKALRGKVLLFAIWGAYTIVYLFLFVWNLTEIDIISDIDEWQTWPGYLILAFRIAIMIWFLLELRETFVAEPDRQKIRFYLHFGAGFLVWFVYLPIVALIGTQVSALWRFKTILSITNAADFLSFVVLTHLLWPSRSAIYFNLQVINRNRIDELEFTGFLDDISTGDEHEIFEAPFPLQRMLSTDTRDSVSSEREINTGLRTPLMSKGDSSPAHKNGKLKKSSSSIQKKEDQENGIIQNTRGRTYSTNSENDSVFL